MNQKSTDLMDVTRTMGQASARQTTCRIFAAQSGQDAHGHIYGDGCGRERASYHVHQNIADHHHGRLVVVPGSVQCL